MSDANVHGGFSKVASRLTREIPSLLVEHGIPGMAVGVCDRSGVTWSAGFGVNALGRADPVTTQTMFSIQSGSKMYTATAVMLAVQQGMLELDASVTTYLPEFTVRSRWEPAPQERMTLCHLLSHRAGFTHEAPLGGNFDDRDSSFEEHCRSISDTWLRFPVGHHYEYSNLGIDLAGYIVQRVSGIPFHAFVQKELLDPLGLRRTTFDHASIAQDRDRAVGHSGHSDQVPLRVPMVGAGGAYTSIDDALRYLQFHLAGGHGVLHEDLLKQMYEIPNPLPGQRFGYGLGVAVARWNGRRILNHGGGGFGFQSDMAWDPAAGIAVATLTNTDHPVPSHLASDILCELTGDEPSTPEVPSAVELDPATLGGIAGAYIGRGGTLARIDLDGSKLLLHRGEATQILAPVSENEVVVEDDGNQRFRLLGHDGRPGRAYLVSADDGVTYYRSDPPIVTDDAMVRSYAIDYMGTQAVTLQLRTGRDATTLEAHGLLELPPLELTAQAPGLYFCPMGEALDLTASPPTYANIPFERRPPIRTYDLR
ncbi:serine hydrolase domain-containing protein [Actinopolymorpha alba]|uniref:serine hydrolase domain-containing protein n=1 Tax=Actinopolymorpha alba TaxID=533267 RepID=UPI0003603280|nr:serine hydrolase domain-containing protein [Actinopolymorpha alba]